MIALSASGVSMHRMGPNFSTRPTVALNTPPSTPTSSPSTTTRSSFSICSCKAALMPSTIDKRAMGHLADRPRS